MISSRLERNLFANNVLKLYGFCTLLLLAGCGTPGNYSAPNSTYQVSGSVKAGSFAINRIQLEFANGLSSLTIKKGQKVSPVAKLKYQGTGVLSASWLVDELVVEQVNISLSHGSLLTLSPKSSTLISTFPPGTHYITLKINRPGVEFKQPKLKYFIVN